MSLREKFTGTGIAIVTPFHADGKIDWDSLKKLIEFWIAGKVEYLWCWAPPVKALRYMVKKNNRFFLL